MGRAAGELVVAVTPSRNKEGFGKAEAQEMEGKRETQVAFLI